MRFPEDRATGAGPLGPVLSGGGIAIFLNGGRPSEYARSACAATSAKITGASGYVNDLLSSHSRMYSMLVAPML